MFKKYPFVKQTGLKDCGVSCLQMIIKYYQGYVGIKMLQEMTKTTKNGTTAYGLIEAAKEIGFTASGVKTNLSNINKNNMILPCIANVTIDNTYNHYFVIYEIDYKNKNLIIADPANKIKKISFTDFEKIWNNTFLFMHPIKKIPLYTKEQKSFDFIINIIFYNKKYVINIIILSIFYSLFSIIGSYYLKFIVDSLINLQSRNYSLFIFVIFLLFTCLKLLSDLFRNNLLVFLNTKIDYLLTNDIFKNIIFLPYNYYRNHTTGEIISRMEDLSKVREFINKVIIIFFVDLPLSIISCILLYFISEKLFFISIIIFILYIITMIIFTPIFNTKIKKVQNKKADYTSYMIESISGFESIKGISIENNIINNFKNKFNHFLNSIFSLENIYNKQNFIKEFICDIGTIIIVFVGSLLIIEKNLTIGGLLFFNSLFNYFLSPYKNILEFNIIFKEASNAIKRVFEIIVPENKNGVICKKIDGNINFKNLTFSYNDRYPILKNINISIKPKEKIMIIGSSGSGKSTLVKLLLRYHKVKRNNLNIDSIDINDYEESCLKNNILYISQNETLFTDSLYNNIDLDKKLNCEQFLEITKLCYIDDIIKKSNVGYNMLLEENGFNLSGGERQRIILARSLIRNFEVLIIDEGLNQIDVSLERKILKNILNKYKDKTIIIISHRLENMDLFNRIIEFSNHKVKKDVCKSG